MGDIAIRGNKLTKSVLHAASPVGNTIRAIKKIGKITKDHINTKKGKFPETESLTHQVGPYTGDVGSEGKKLNKPGRRQEDIKRAPDPTRARHFGGGRTRLLEELGRVEAEPSNRNRRAEIARVHSELNKGYATGGRVGLKKGGKSDKKWIQKAVNPKHKGYCTPMTKKTCTPKRKALARTFKKKAKTGW